jgi:hypothetical protein
MESGFSTWKDVFQVLVVPLSAALIAVLWQALAARRRRRNFEELIRQEIAEAAPNRKSKEGVLASSRKWLKADTPVPWHANLKRRFLHEDLIGNPVANAEFIMSLDPALSYSLSQMWISFSKGQETAAGQPEARTNAVQFCWYLGRTAAYLDRKDQGNLLGTVWVPWVETIEAQYPHTKLDLNVDHLPRWSEGTWHVRKRMVELNQEHKQKCRRIHPEESPDEQDSKLHLIQAPGAGG